MDEPVERLLASLVHESFALALATNDAGPSGVLFPPEHAAAHDDAFDHLRLECVARLAPEGELEAKVVFLQATGPSHEALDRCVTVPRSPVPALARAPQVGCFAFAQRGGPILEGGVALGVTELYDGLARVTATVRNTTPDAGASPEDPDGLLCRSLLATHVVVRAHRGRFVSPLNPERRYAGAVAGCRSVNTWPVLASRAEDVVLGAAIVLGDHPELAPESRGDLLDARELDDALRGRDDAPLV